MVLREPDRVTSRSIRLFAHLQREAVETARIVDAGVLAQVEVDPDVHTVEKLAVECTAPPSTSRTTPVMYDASSDRRNVTALAMSSGSPILPSGTAAA